MPKLDVNNATSEQKEEILKYASEIRKFEIERFWQRSIFFWGFIGASFVAYAQLYEKPQKIVPVFVACFGLLCSVAWTLQNRGSKYWQEAWEQKVQAVETEVPGAQLFSNWEPIQRKGFWGSSKFSVSKLTIALSDFTVLTWGGLLAAIFPMPGISTFVGSSADLAVAITLSYIVCLLIWGRSKPHPRLK
jgi:hypothetical protein